MDLRTTRKPQPRLPSNNPPLRGRSRKAVFGVVGAVGGSVAGALAGYRVDRLRDCACDDPGLAGIIVGTPVGAVVGAVLGVTLAGR
jgi:hypothetical protein